MLSKIEAIIREEKLDSVREALEQDGYSGITVCEVMGRGRQGGLKLQWRTKEYRVDLLPKVKIEVVVLDKDVSKTVATIMSKARTGDIGDGKIFVFPVENVIRVRTGECGVNAL